MLTFLLLSLLVLVHELGHFLAARKFGVKVEEFGVGLPPKAMTLGKRGETEYTLNWLPIGGFVRLLGEDSDPTMWEKLNPLVRKRALYAKPAWQRAIVMLAGIGMNFLVGIVMFGIVYSLLGVPQVEGEQVLITEVANDSPAERAGLEYGEVILRVGDEEVSTSEQFVEIVSNKGGELVSLYVTKLESDGTTADSSRQVSLIPRLDPPEGEGALGVGIVGYPVIVYEQKPWYTAPFYGAVEGMNWGTFWQPV